MTVGDRIRMFRKARGYSADELGELIGKDRATVYRYESSEIEDMPTGILIPLAKALGTTPAVLMGWDDTIQSKDDIELQEYLEELKNRSEMRMLFKLAKNATKEDVEKAVRIVEALIGNNT